MVVDGSLPFGRHGSQESLQLVTYPRQDSCSTPATGRKRKALCLGSCFQLPVGTQKGLHHDKSAVTLSTLAWWLGFMRPTCEDAFTGVSAGLKPRFLTCPRTVAT